MRVQRLLDAAHHRHRPGTGLVNQKALRVSGAGFKLTAVSGYGFVALNNDTTFAGTCGFMGGASGDSTLYLFAPAGFPVDTRVNNVTCLRVAGALATSFVPLLVSDTTDATSTTSAAHVVSGGIAVAKRLCLDGATGKTIKYVNGTANAAVATTMGSVGPTGSTAGNPLGWIRIDVAGTDRFIPYW